MLTNSIATDIKHQFRYGNMVMKLIFVNVAVFLFFGIFYLGSFLFQNNTLYNLLLSKVELPASLPVLFYQPWSVFTYMFLHTGVFHVLFNMLWFYWFGEIFVLFQGDKKILPVYLLGGISGALIYLLAYNLFPVFKSGIDVSFMLGASASVLAIVFATATLAPDYEIRLFLFGNVRIKYVALVSLLLDIINIPYGNAGGYIAHTGGALSGYLFVRTLQNGIGFSSLAALFKRQAKLKVSRGESTLKETSNKRSDNEQQRVDEILDKIARSGYDSLSKEEKDFLFKYSKKK